MEEQREETESSGDCREPMGKAGKELSLSSKIGTVDGEVDVPRQDPCMEDADTVSGACDVNENPNDGILATEDGSFKAEDGNTGDSDSDEKQVKADVASVEEMVGSVSTKVEAKDNVDKTISSDDVERTDAITQPETETSNGDTGTVEVEIEKTIVKPVDERERSELSNDVQRVNEPVKLREVEMKDERENGISHESAGEEECLTSTVYEVTDENAKGEVQDSSGASDAELNVQTEMSRPTSVEADMFSALENNAGQEKESTKKSEEDSNKMGVDSEQDKEEKMGVSYNEHGNLGCETSDQEKELVNKSEEDYKEQEKEEKVIVSYYEHGNSRCETSDADQEKELAEKSEEDNNKMDVASEQEKNKEVGLSYEEHDNSGCEISEADQEKESAKKREEDNNKMDVGLNEQGNPGSETADDKHGESVKVPEESTHLIKGETDKGNPGTVSEVSSAAEICREEETNNVNQKEENEEAMEIDKAAEEQVEKDVKVDGALDNAGNESVGASMVQPQDDPTAEADRNDSNVEEMEIDDRNDNVDMATDLTGTIESADAANPNSPTEDAATGEVEPLDHNALFDPSSDITNFIDFTGVSSWSGNIQDLKTETGNVSLKEDKKAIDMAEDCKETLKSVDATVNSESHDNLCPTAEGIQNESSVAFEAESSAAATDCPRVPSDAFLGSEKYQEDKDYESLDKNLVDQQDEMREKDYNAHEAPSIDPNQKEDTEMEENPNSSDYADDGTGSDMKTNGLKRKADVLSEDLSEEGRKTVSFAKVSSAQGPSFKIGACIARAASQMAGSPSILKGNFGDETLSVDSFVSQLHCAATEPVKENVVSEVAAGFFLDFRNSSASQQVTLEKLSSKRPSNSNIEGTEAFEFEEMGDTYWTDKVINNGGEEQTPPTEKAKYQVVPVELKPAQVQRTRRPYRRRQSQISIPLHSTSEKPANFDENAPAELIMNFSETDTIPPEKSLSKMFRHFGPIRESETEVDKENNRARVVYRKGADAEVAYNSAGRFSIFGTKAVNYELSYTITETFKVKPYVVSLGEEDAAPSLPA